jgi:signal transduction histidine kinase
MNARLSLRSRMMILFSAVVAILLAASFTGFYLMFDRVLHAQLDRKLKETAAPIIADLIADPEERDVDLLNIPGQFFEVVNAAGSVVQRSQNLPVPVPAPDTDFQTINIAGVGELRLAGIPFIAAGQSLRFVAGASTRDVESALDTLRSWALVLFPLSLLLTAAISSIYVARSLRPIVELTGHASGMIEKLGHVSPPRRAGADEVDVLAATFNQLFNRLETVIGQLRQFVSDASHELRTPLSVLRGETELLLTRQRSPSEYESAIRIIEAELKKLSHIVDGLFTLSMADAGQLRIAPEPLYLEEVLEETCTLATPLANSKQIRIDRELQADVLFTGDAAFLRQLFFIFIDNAIKYSPSGTSLKIRLEADKDVRVRFQDQGIGIASEHQPRIFERFFRVSQTGSSDTQSGGLGLAIAQAIVRAHRGRIECESKLGLGSIFIVSFPLQ